MYSTGTNILRFFVIKTVCNANQNMREKLSLLFFKIQIS